MPAAKKQIDQDARTRRPSATQMRESRTEADTQRKLGNMSAQERRRWLRKNATQDTILPSPPEIPGFHLCWLTTTNPADPIFRRMRDGYAPVKASEIPNGEFDYYKAKNGEFDGCIVCNEMVLFKIPEEIYLDLMAIYHHEEPNEQERSIRDNLQNQVQQFDRSGRPLGQMEPGLAELGNAKEPIFN